MDFYLLSWTVIEHHRIFISNLITVQYKKKNWLMCFRLLKWIFTSLFWLVCGNLMGSDEQTQSLRQGGVSDCWISKIKVWDLGFSEPILNTSTFWLSVLDTNIFVPIYTLINQYSNYQGRHIYVYHINVRTTYGDSQTVHRVIKRNFIACSDMYNFASEVCIHHAKHTCKINYITAMIDHNLNTSQNTIFYLHEWTKFLSLMRWSGSDT